MGNGIRRPAGPQHKPVLLYDGECRFCRAMAHIVAARSDPAALSILPWSDHAASPFMNGLDPATRDRSMHLSVRDGGTLSGPAAFVRLLQYVRGASWICWLTRRSAVARWLAGLGYFAVARCRGVLSRVTPDRPAVVRR